MRADTADSEARVTVRYFAAARAAPAGTTVRELVETLHTRGPGLSAVLARCTYLCDGVAVRDLQTALGDTQTVDVLPPFAGG